MLTENSRLIDVYETAVGRDILKRLLMEKGISDSRITKTPLGRLKLRSLERSLGADLVRALLDLVNGEVDFVLPTKGAIEARWYKDAVIYQIYPRSFKDSNGDGIGDLAGILSRLDYLSDLGVDAIWLSPICDSPNDDMGYDIRDYRKIMDEMGTMADFEALLAACHARGMKLILDMVLNHSSDEHEWYQRALAGEKKYQDYYVFREGKGSGLPEAKGSGFPPNNWQSFFSGPAWRYEPRLGKWALHLFSSKQMDFNWDNAALRQELFEVLRFWLDKGVDGFRLDVINYVSKVSGLPDGSSVIGEMLKFTGIEHYYYGPNLHAYLREMQEQALKPYGAFSVGETPGLGFEMSKLVTNEARGELNLVIGFDHLEMPGKTRWDDYRYDLENYKQYYLTGAAGLGHQDWMSLFFENHDNPRMVSKVNPDPAFRVVLAKLLAVMQLSLRGTPFIYQGQELGAVNQAFASVSDLRDVESLNKYRELLAVDFESDSVSVAVSGGAASEALESASIEAGISGVSVSGAPSSGISPSEAWAVVLAGSRDHARTVLDWTPEGGFMDSDVACCAGLDSALASGSFDVCSSAVKPWLESHSVGDGFSVEEQLADSDSILCFYRRMLRLRKSELALQYGDFDCIAPQVKGLFMYERSGPASGVSFAGFGSEEAVGLHLDELSPSRILVELNLTEKKRRRHRPFVRTVIEADLLLSNYAEVIGDSEHFLQPYEARVYRLG